MSDTPRNRTLMRRVAEGPGSVLLAIGLGFAAFFGLEVADRAITARPPATAPPAAPTAAPSAAPPAAEAKPPTADLPPRVDGVGNELVRRAAVAIDRDAPLAAAVRQQGWLDADAVSFAGDYVQQGAGPSRRMLMRLAGEAAGEPARVLLVSDGRFLWNDISWGNGPKPRRVVTRLDLRRVRRALAESGPTDSLAIDPSAWSRFGGLPMLLAGLDEAFQFGPPARLQAMRRPVLATVGRWRPEVAGALFDEDSIPPRAPHHVVVALAHDTLLPVLVEYRGASDPLAAPGLADGGVLRASERPLLKIELAIDPSVAAAPDPRAFTYVPGEGAWSDVTERELRAVSRRRGGAEVAATAGARPR